MNWLKPESIQLDRRRVMSSYKRALNGEDGEIILQDLAQRVFGRVITDDTPDHALRAWSGEIKMFKYIINKVYSKGD